jgi:hypothetical protein
MRHVPPENTSLSAAQLRKRLTDKLTHITQRLKEMGAAERSGKMGKAFQAELINTTRRLRALDDKIGVGHE